MKTRITKSIGGITDKYWAKIIYNEDDSVSQIHLHKYTGHPSRGDVKVVTWVMDSEDAVNLINSMAKELQSCKESTKKVKE